AVREPRRGAGDGQVEHLFIPDRLDRVDDVPEEVVVDIEIRLGLGLDGEGHDRSLGPLDGEDPARWGRRSDGGGTGLRVRVIQGYLLEAGLNRLLLELGAQEERRLREPPEGADGVQERWLVPLPHHVDGMDGANTGL